MKKVAVIGVVGKSVFLSVDKFHQGGETIEAESVHFELGGKGFNQAVAAARYGAEVSFLAAVGADCITEVKGFLDKEKVSSTLILKDSQTAFASIITDKNGSNRVTVYQGARLSQSDVIAFKDAIKNADMLLLSNEVLEPINVAAIKIAKENGVKVVLNPAPARKTCSYILENVDLFTPNEHETLDLDDKENVIITLGSRGCLVKRDNENYNAYKLGKVVDTTGAGDTFNGVLSAMLAKGRSITDAVKTANLAASISVTKKYAVSSIPTKREIEKIKKERVENF